MPSTGGWTAVSIGEGLPHGSPRKDPNEKIHGSKAFIVMAETGYVEPYPASQNGPEINHLLQEGVSGKGSLLAAPSRPLCSSLAWRSVLSRHDLWSHPFPHLHVEGLGCCQYMSDDHKWGNGLQLVTGAWIQDQAELLLSLQGLWGFFP